LPDFSRHNIPKQYTHWITKWPKYMYVVQNGQRIFQSFSFQGPPPKKKLPLVGFLVLKNVQSGNPGTNWCSGKYRLTRARLPTASFTQNLMSVLRPVLRFWDLFPRSVSRFWRQFSGSKVGYQGSMLWSQFSAIFPNFRRKNWRFFSKTNVMIIFSNFSFVLSQKRQFFR
jgi:hypothetical protein